MNSNGPAKQLTYYQIRYLRNKEQINRQTADWRKRNPDKVRAIGLRYRQNHPERIRERNRRQNIDRRLSGAWTNYYEANKEKLNIYRKKWNSDLRAECFSAYGAKCVCCGEACPEFLTVDHTEGGGTKERRLLGRSGISFYYHLKKEGWPQDGYRLLCMNCNFSLGRCGYCPHKGRPE